MLDTYDGDVTLRNGGFHVTFDNEASLRDNLARVANLHGWRTQTEVSAGEWGRIDLVLDPDEFRCALIEFKLELRTARQVRAGLQQVDRYDRWWRANRPAALCPDVWLVAPNEDDIDLALANRMTDLYPGVRVATAARLMEWMADGGSDPRLSLARLEREKRRLQAAQDRVRFRAVIWTVQDLSQHWPEMKPALTAAARRAA